MATILEFRRTEDAAPRSGQLVEGTLGQIIIFPGVRIERHEPAEAPRDAPSSARRRTTRIRKKSRA